MIGQQMVETLEMACALATHKVNNEWTDVNSLKTVNRDFYGGAANVES